MKRPIVVAVIGYVIGILWGLYFNFSIVLFYFIITVSYILFKKYFHQKNKFKLLSLKRYLRYIKLIIPLKTLIYIVLISIISNTIVILQNNKYDKLYDEGNIKLKAIIVSNKQEKEYSNIYKIKVQVVENGKRFKKYKGTYLYLKVNKKQDIDLKFGDEVIINGDLEKPENQRNFKGYDSEKNFKINKIYGTVRRKIYRKNRRFKIKFYKYEF